MNKYKFITDGYEEPQIIECLLKGRFDDLHLNERYVKKYFLEMSEAFRTTCRGTFRIREQEQLKATLVDERDMNMGAAGAAQGLLFLAEMMQNPNKVAQLSKQESLMQRVPEMARNDAMLMIERHSCDSPVVRTFINNAKRFCFDSSVPMNMTAPVYRQACRDAGNPYDFCMCFLLQANTDGLSRQEKKALIEDFETTASAIWRSNVRHYAPCQQ